MSFKFWSNVNVDIQTAIGAALTITAITKAATGVVTYSGATDPANGDYVYLLVRGMRQLNKTVVRVANVNAAANTFELEGENTSLYETFVSGTFAVITFGASADNIQDVNASGGDPEFADISTIHDNVRRRVPTVTSPMSISFTALHDLLDPFAIEAKKASKDLVQRGILIRFADGTKMVGAAYVSGAGVPTGSAQQVVQTALSLEFQGLPTNYAT
jgi:Phage tail tube protein, TTP